MQGENRSVSSSKVGWGFSGVLISLCLHGVLVAAVLWGWESNEEFKPKRYTPKFVQAKLVELKPKSKAKTSSAPTPKVVDLTKKRREADARKKAAQAKARRDAKRKAEKERKAKAAKDKAAKDKAAKDKAAREKAARDKAAKDKAAQEKLAREQALQQQLDADLKAERQAFEAEQQAEEDEQYAQSYSAIIAQRIENYWSRPPSARKGMQCELRLQLVPTGRVISVTVIKSSGNAAFDRSAEQAVKKAEQFSELKQLPPAVFERNFRQFTLLFNPKDLRL